VRAVVEQGSKADVAKVGTSGARAYRISDADTAFRARPAKELPPGTSLSDVVKSLPREVFEVNEKKSWLHFAVTAVAMPLSLLAVHLAPWYLLPVAWFVAGTAATGLFTLGHDAGHNTFSKNPLVNDIVGNLTLSMLVYPFEQWRIQHNIHHRNTNMLRNAEIPGAEIADNAWQPIDVGFFNRVPLPRIVTAFLKLGWSAFWYQLSILHWVIYHFNSKKFTKRQMPKVVISWICCGAFAATVFPALLAWGGPWALVKYWLMPWLGYHFWMSTFTLIHHTAPHIQFKEKTEWNAAREQLSGTVHCDFPRWIEVLTHDINVHIPHHVSTGIPSYNLKAAYSSLKDKWGPYLNETAFSWKLCREIIDNCQVFDDGEYITYEEAQRRAALRRA